MLYGHNADEPHQHPHRADKVSRVGMRLVLTLTVRTRYQIYKYHIKKEKATLSQLYLKTVPFRPSISSHFASLLTRPRADPDKLKGGSKGTNEMTTFLAVNLRTSKTPTPPASKQAATPLMSASQTHGAHMPVRLARCQPSSVRSAHPHPSRRLRAAAPH